VFVGTASGFEVVGSDFFETCFFGALDFVEEDEEEATVVGLSSRSF